MRAGTRAAVRPAGGARSAVLPADRRVLRRRIGRDVRVQPAAGSAGLRGAGRRTAGRRTGQDRWAAGVGGRRRSKPVRPRPGQGAAFRVVPSAGRQDAGGRARRGRGAADPADPLAGGRTDRQGDRRTARLRRRPGRSRRPGARHRSPAVRPQRRIRARSDRGGRRRVRGQRTEPAAAQPAGTQDHHRGRPTGRAEPDQGVAGRGDQVPVAATENRRQVRRLRRRCGRLRVDQTTGARSAADAASRRR